ncbi:hypothetical protein V1477_003046 [Vespula maculifrons]|uniref:Uncharacterized protein n=1 Tax=Vespula maculifrons TaxID=7453 RepID=A0ABD2CTF0_VESMC
MGKARLAGFTADTTLVACFQVKLEETFGLRIRPYMYLCDIPWNTKNKHHFVPVPHDFSSGNVPTTWVRRRRGRIKKDSQGGARSYRLSFLRPTTTTATTTTATTTTTTTKTRLENFANKLSTREITREKKRPKKGKKEGRKVDA